MGFNIYCVYRVLKRFLNKPRLLVENNKTTLFTNKKFETQFIFRKLCLKYFCNIGFLTYGSFTTELPYLIFGAVTKLLKIITFFLKTTENEIRKEKVVLHVPILIFRSSSVFYVGNETGIIEIRVT